MLPTLLVLAMFFYGWSGYLALRNVPKGAMEVTVTARMWSWSFLPQREDQLQTVCRGEQTGQG